MRIFAAIALLAALGAAAATNSVTVSPSSLSFKQIGSACPGALAGIAFTLNHARIAEQPGVATDIDDSNPPMQTIVLTGTAGAAATVTIDASKHSVSAKNVKLSGKTVACVSPD